MARALIALTVGVAALAGCGPSDARDSGPVTFDSGPRDAGGDDGASLDGDAPDAEPDGGPTPPPPPSTPGAPARPTTAWVLLAGDDPASARPPIEAPEAPRFAGSCRSGWREVTVGDDPTTCEPWPESGRVDCPESQMHLPGRPGCERVDPTACPVGDEWPTIAAGERALFVRAGAMGGDGSRAAPFGTIADALASGGAAGAVIALAAGRYDESVVVEASAMGVTLRGACAESTVIAPSSAEAPAVLVGAPGVTVESLSIEGAREGVSVEPAGAATLRGLEIRGTRAEGVRVRGTLDARRLRVIRAGADGVYVEPGARGTIESAEVSRWAQITGLNRAAIRAAGMGARAEISDVSAHDGANDGISFTTNASGSASGVVIERASSVGFYIIASNVTSSDVVVRETRGAAPGRAVGVGLYRGATGSHERLLSEGHPDAALSSTGSSRVELADVVLRDAARSGMLTPRGAVAAEGADLMVERVAILRCGDTGLGAVDAGSSISGTDVRVVAGDGDADGAVVTGATLMLARAAIETAGGAGVRADGDAAVTMTDLDVVVSRGTTGADATGLLFSGARGRFANVAIDAGDAVGIALLPNTRLGAMPNDVTVEDVAIVGGAGDGETSADGILLTAGALHATHTLITGARGAAVSIAGAESSATLDDLTVVDLAGSGVRVTDGAALATTRALIEPGASGIVVRGAASSLDAMDVLLEGPALAYGIAVIDGARATAARVRIDGALGLGAGAFGAESSLEITGALITGTRAATGGAVGVGALDGAAVSIGGFEVTRSAECGLEVDATSDLDATSGLVTGNALGACIWDETYDDARVTASVVYDDNGQDVAHGPRLVPPAPP